MVTFPSLFFNCFIYLFIFPQGNPRVASFILLKFLISWVSTCLSLLFQIVLFFFLATYFLHDGSPLSPPCPILISFVFPLLSFHLLSQNFSSTTAITLLSNFLSMAPFSIQIYRVPLLCPTIYLILNPLAFVPFGFITFLLFTSLLLHMLFSLFLFTTQVLCLILFLFTFCCTFISNTLWVGFFKCWGENF